MARAVSPFLITIPLRDLSIVNYDAAKGQVTGVFMEGADAIPRPVFNVTCPTGLREQQLPMTAYPALMLGAGSATPATVVVQSMLMLSYTAPISASPPRASVDSGAAALAGAGASRMMQGVLSTAASTATATSPAYILQADCGTIGPRAFMCGPGMEGKVVTYQCPGLAPVPSCVWFDASKGGWSNAGCQVASSSDTAVVCACTHLTDFSIRFAAVPAPAQKSVYAPSVAPGVTVIGTLLLFPGYYGVLAVVCLWWVVLLARGLAVGTREQGAFREAIMMHPEFSVPRALALGATGSSGSPSSAASTVASTSSSSGGAPDAVTAYISGHCAALAPPLNPVLASTSGQAQAAALLFGGFATLSVAEEGKAASQAPIPPLPLFSWASSQAFATHPILSIFSTAFNPHLSRSSQSLLSLLSTLGLLTLCQGMYVTFYPPANPTWSPELGPLDPRGTFAVALGALLALALMVLVGQVALAVLDEAVWLQGMPEFFHKEVSVRAAAERVLGGFSLGELEDLAGEVGGSATALQAAFTSAVASYGGTLASGSKRVLFIASMFLALAWAIFYVFYYAVLFPLLRGSVATTGVLVAWALAQFIQGVLLPLPSAAVVLVGRLVVAASGRISLAAAPLSARVPLVALPEAAVVVGGGSGGAFFTWGGGGWGSRALAGSMLLRGAGGAAVLPEELAGKPRGMMLVYLMLRLGVLGQAAPLATQEPLLALHGPSFAAKGADPTVRGAEEEEEEVVALASKLRMPAVPNLTVTGLGRGPPRGRPPAMLLRVGPGSRPGSVGALGDAGGAHHPLAHLGPAPRGLPRALLGRAGSTIIGLTRAQAQGGKQ